MGIFWGPTGMRTKAGRAQEKAPTVLLWLPPEQTKVSYCKAVVRFGSTRTQSYVTTTQAHFVSHAPLDPACYFNSGVD